MFNGSSPLGSREYVTLRFSQEDEEHLIPRALLEKSRVITDLIRKSHDSHIQIKDIASATFEDLIHFISGNHQTLEPERINLMIDAAHKLELNDAETQLTNLFKQKSNP